MIDVYDSATGKKAKGCFAMNNGTLMKFSKSHQAFIPVDKRKYFVRIRR